MNPPSVIGTAPPCPRARSDASAPPCHPERSEGPMYFPWVGSSPSRGYSDTSRFWGEHVSEVAPPCTPERSEGPMFFPRDRQFPFPRVLRCLTPLGRTRERSCPTLSS